MPYSFSISTANSTTVIESKISDAHNFSSGSTVENAISSIFSIKKIFHCLQI